MDSIAAQQQKNRSNHADGPLPLDGRNYYENLCSMRAVNQSVGRAFRHADDYAAVNIIDINCLEKISKLTLK